MMWVGVILPLGMIRTAGNKFHIPLGIGYLQPKIFHKNREIFK